MNKNQMFLYSTDIKQQNLIIKPTKRSDAQPLVEREKQFECHPVEFSRS